MSVSISESHFGLPISQPPNIRQKWFCKKVKYKRLIFFRCPVDFMKFRNPPFAARGLALTDQKTKEADSIIVSLFLLWLISTRVGGLC